MKKLVVFASGRGTNFGSIVDACLKNVIDAKVMLLVCDNEEAQAVIKAKNYNIESFVFNPKKYKKKSDYETEICNLLDKINPDLICLAGYMRIIGKTLLEKYEGKMINIHPALLPSFKGAHGIEDAYNYGVKVFGVTVHFVSHELDGGKIIMQRGFEYYGNDMAMLEAKIHQVEHVLYVEAINKVLKENL